MAFTVTESNWDKLKEVGLVSEVFVTLLHATSTNTIGSTKFAFGTLAPELGNVTLAAVRVGRANFLQHAI
jgi:hypothetical protein